MPQHLVFFIFLNNLELLPLHLEGMTSPFDHPYFSALTGFVILAIILVGRRKYKEEKRAKAELT